MAKFIIRKQDGSRHHEFQLGGNGPWVIAPPELVAEIDRLKQVIQAMHQSYNPGAPDFDIEAAMGDAS